MKKVIFIVMVLLMTGCTPRGCQRMEKTFQFSERHYDIKQFSGGECIGRYPFYGILNDVKESDGYFFFYKDTLVEVSGDLTIKSWE